MDKDKEEKTDNKFERNILIMGIYFSLIPLLTHFLTLLVMKIIY